MKLVKIKPRENWKEIITEIGLEHLVETKIAGDVPYWTENRAYEFSKEDIEKIRKATEDLERMSLETVEYCIKNELYDELRIPKEYVPLVETSWKEKDYAVYGRYDLSYSGSGDPKMFEYNADTPATLLEAGAAQANWLEDHIERYSVPPGSIQFNEIEKNMIRAWTEYTKTSQYKEGEPIHVGCSEEDPEDYVITEYMRTMIEKAGIPNEFTFLEHIFLNPDGTFSDVDDNEVRNLFKFQPWELIIEDEFGPELKRRSFNLIEPAWKYILSNKAVLPIMWKLFEGHPNLLATYTTPDKLGGTYVRKPVFSREGANIDIIREGENIIKTDGVYDVGDYIYQEYAPLHKFDGKYHPMIGSWIIGGKPAGIVIREAQKLITDLDSCFVPHYVANDFSK